MQSNHSERKTYELHPIELAEYTRIPPKMSGLSSCMNIDESSSYKRWGHPLWMIVSDGDPYLDKWLAISISSAPHIVAIGNNLNRDDGELNDIMDYIEFVAKFQAILYDIADEKTDSGIIYDILEHNRWRDLTQSEVLNLKAQLSPTYYLSRKSL